MKKIELKKSYKMRKQIERVEKEFGHFDTKDFDIEADEINRTGKGFYDFVQMHCKITNMTVVISHEGDVSGAGHLDRIA